MERKDVAADRLEWSVDVGSNRPQKRLVVAIVAFIAGFAGLKLVGLLFGLLGLVVVLVSTVEVFLPLRYRIDAKGARVRCGFSVTAIDWSDVRRLIAMADGVRLSPLEKPSRLDEFRGVYLRFSDNGDVISGKIRQFWNGDTRPLDGRTDGAGDEGSDQQGR